MKEIAKQELLVVENITRSFGGLNALSNVSFSVISGQIVGLIGPNGAGKSTMLNTIGGVYAPSSGRIIFRGEDIGGRAPHEIARKGIGRTFQRDLVYTNEAVFSHVLAGCYLSSKRKWWQELLRGPKKDSELREKAEWLLNLTGLWPWRDKLAGQIPHREIKKLGIAMALATGARLLMLDEPLAGINVQEVTEFSKIIRTENEERGIGFIVVDHNASAIMRLCDYVVVLDFGRKICEGLPEHVVQDEAVIKAYLGLSGK